jgi:hypothetical protein
VLIYMQRGMGASCSASIKDDVCNRCVTLSLEPTLSYQNAPDVIEQDLVREFSHFFASDFKVR